MVKGGSPHSSKPSFPMYARITIFLFSLAGTALFCGGCAAIPEVKHQPQYHNPFPQLHRVAILPFFNLSSDPTVNQDEVAEAYFNELQKIPGFEVMPPGVAKQWLVANRVQIDGSTDFQMLARRIGSGCVDSRGGHGITRPTIRLESAWLSTGSPPIRRSTRYRPVMDSPGALRRRSTFPTRWCLKRNSPWLANSSRRRRPTCRPRSDQRARRVDRGRLAVSREYRSSRCRPRKRRCRRSRGAAWRTSCPDLPPDWPDPRGFVPRPPSPVRPPYRPQYEPVIIAHAHLPWRRRAADEAVGRLLFLPRRRADWWLARLSLAQRRLYPILLLSPHYRDSRRTRGER